ncbi:MAG: Dabb family protein [Bacteroidota bacterium]
MAPRIFVFCLLSLVFFACQERVVEKEVIVEKVIDNTVEPGLIHTVYFWLNDDVDAASAKDFEDGVWSLEAIPSVKRMFVGPAASTPSRDVVDNSFDYALIVWFDDVAGHDAYQVHDIHTKFVEEQGGKFKKVQVHDNVLQEMK